MSRSSRQGVTSGEAWSRLASIPAIRFKSHCGGGMETPASALGPASVRCCATSAQATNPTCSPSPCSSVSTTKSHGSATDLDSCGGRLQCCATREAWRQLARLHGRRGHVWRSPQLASVTNGSVASCRSAMMSAGAAPERSLEESVETSRTCFASCLATHARAMACQA